MAKENSFLERILIIRNQGLGDLLLITPAIRAIRQLHPQAHIAICVGEWSRVALENNPDVDEILSYPDPWIQNQQPIGYLRLVLRLRRGRFDRAYIFHSHTLIHLIAALAGIRERFGFYDLGLKKAGKYLTAKTEWQPNTNRYIADNYLDVPRLAGHNGDDLSLQFSLPTSEQAAADSILVHHRLTPGDYFILAPGGGVNPRQNVFEKRWGTDKYVDLCRLLQKEFAQPIILVGSKEEQEIGQTIRKLAGDRVIDLIGQIPFRITAGLIRRCRMLICNDSSVMHIAVAFQIPSLSVFGPSNPHSLLPVSQINQWIGSGVDCSPCYCNSIFPGCPHLRCMTELTAVRVRARIAAMLAPIATPVS